MHPLLRRRAHLAIRPHTYRGVEGFSIHGTDANGYRTRVFARTHDGAVKIKEILSDPTADHLTIDRYL